MNLSVENYVVESDSSEYQISDESEYDSLDDSDIDNEQLFNQGKFKYTMNAGKIIDYRNYKEKIDEKMEKNDPEKIDKKSSGKD
jgi:hypothetical protein